MVQNNELDVDDVVDYLRGAYKEYQRKPMGPFQAMVARAISCVQDQGGVAKPELKLQVCVMLAVWSRGESCWQEGGRRAV